VPRIRNSQKLVVFAQRVVDFSLTQWKYWVLVLPRVISRFRWRSLSFRLETCQRIYANLHHSWRITACKVQLRKAPAP
jgi:hypothetical protein